MVYLLISTPCPDRFYVGQTQNLAVCIEEHNSGYGSLGTRCPQYIPWAVCSYISGLMYLSQSDRMSIEGKWARMNKRSMRNGHTSLEQMVENGRSVVNDHNASVKYAPEMRLNYIVLIQRRFGLENAAE